MSGAWEQREANKMVLGILHVETTTVAWALALRRLLIPGPILPVTGMPFDMSRNTVAQACLNGPFQWLAFLDSDVAPEPDAYLRLISHNKPIVSGVYYRRSPPHGLPVAQKILPKGGRTWINNPLPQSGLMEVDVVGAGLLVIHRSVLEKLNSKPIHPTKKFFYWGVDQRGVVPDMIGESEDFSFNNYVKSQFGIPIMLDCGVRARHIGFSQAEEDKLVPLETR